MPDEPPPPANILLVDDRPENLLTLEAVLSGLGENPVRAASGEEALALLGERDFAVVLLDVRMPGLSGFETAKRMRATEHARHTPVIFLSAAESPEFPVAEAYRLGAVDFLLKPFAPDVLRAKVAVFVDLFHKGERVRDLERRERERAEQALRETEQRFARFMEHLPGLAWIKDLSGRYLYANDAAGRAFGRHASDLYGKTDDDTFPPDTAAAFRENDRRAAASPVGVQTVEILTHPDGSVHHSLVSKFPIPGPDGKPAMVGGVAIDITDRRRAEAELTRVTAESDRRRQLYETILSNTPDLAYVFDLDHRFAYANEVLLRMWGKTWDEAIGRTCLELGYEPWHAEMHDREIEQVKATKQPIRGEVPFAGTFGRRIYDYIFVPVLGADGEVTAVAGTTRDVTDRKAAEEAVAEAARRKDEFMAMLAHELRNPLAPLRNALHILQLRGTDPGVLEQARGMMDRQVTHLGRLVDDLLDVSRLTTGQVQLRRERLDLARLTRQAAADRRTAYEAKRVSLEVSTPDTPVWVNGDPTRLAQVLDNLLTNALKFTARDGQVYASVAADADGRVVLTVRDTGAGIEPDMLPRLFEPFSQADRTLDRRDGGLGLGLAIVKGLAELHGGSVRAQSGGLGRGAAFTVILPAYSEPPALSSRPPSPRPAARELRVLVVEDNRDAADSLRMLLEAYGYQVEVAYTGPDGVRAAEENRPEVVICDIGLPGMDGYAVAGALRRNPATASSRLIALTGYGQDEDRRRAREAGFDEHLTKPADPAALEALIAAAG
jgi:PAS domain S-box-containing protein